MQTEYTTIKISQATKERLLDRGTMRDSYETLLVKILDRMDEIEEEELRNNNKDPRRVPVAA